jgi:hypothetical protein
MQIIALITIILLAVSLQRIIYNKFSFKNLEYECFFNTAEATEGDEISLTEIIHNNKILPIQWLKVEIYTSKWLEYAKSRSSLAQETRFVTSGYYLRFFQKITRIWKVKCQKRGCYKIEKLTLVSSDLFGLQTCSIPLNVNAKVMVYPGFTDLNELVNITKTLTGNTIIKRWILDDPFIVSGAREYMPNDPLNRIHWKATAKQGTLMIRKNEFTAQESVRIFLNIQTFSYYHPETIDKEIIELGIKICASLIDSTLQAGFPVSIASNGFLPAASSNIFTKTLGGPVHIKNLMEILAQLTFKITCCFDVFLEEKIESIEESQVVFITTYLEESLINNIINLSKRNISVTIVFLGDSYNGDLEKYGIRVFLQA